MNVLVTGGTGYIGFNLVKALKEVGHKVRILDLHSLNLSSRDFSDCEFIQGSVEDPKTCAQAVKDMEIVCHLAWTFSGSDIDSAFDLESERRKIETNLLGTLNLLQASLTEGVNFLFASSAVVYGPTGPIKVDEPHPCHPEKSAIGGPFYGITKLACEKLCLGYQQFGLPTTIFRLHGVFSQGHLGQFERMIEQARAGKPVEVIKEAGGEYIHLRNVLDALLLTLEYPSTDGGVYNLAGSYTYSDLEVARYILEKVNTQSRIKLIGDPRKEMISVSTNKLSKKLNYVPEQGKFLIQLIQQSLQKN